MRKEYRVKTGLWRDWYKVQVKYGWIPIWFSTGRKKGFITMYKNKQDAIDWIERGANQESRVVYKNKP